MTDIARLIADMVSEGVSAEIVGRVAAALAERPAADPVILRDEQAEKRRERDRERKQASRECLRNSAESADRDEAKKEIPPKPPKEKNINIYTPEISNEISAPKRSRRKPETPLPTDCPTAEQICDASTRCDAAGVKINIQFQAERFQNHAQTTDRRCRDWGAAWRNWVSSAIERAGGSPNGQPPSQASPDARKTCIKAFKDTGIWHATWGERPSREELAA